MKKIKCGDANPKGNIVFYYKGSCELEVELQEAYRCVGCGGWFHLDCILKHFELENNHDVARNALKEISKITRTKTIKELCEKGLKPTSPLKKNWKFKI